MDTGDALIDVAVAVAGTDSDRAERIAGEIICERCRVMAVTAVALAVAETDPDRSERLAVAAEEIVWSIASDTERVSALAPLALATSALFEAALSS
jgi:hypothetical protein